MTRPTPAALAFANPTLPELRQCAWCLLVMDRAGAYAVQPGHKIRSATHGICPKCKEQIRAEIDAASTPRLVAA